MFPSSPRGTRRLSRSLIALVLAAPLPGSASPVQEAYLKASNAGVLYRFGWSVDIDGDTAVVGSRSEWSNATGINGNQNDRSALESGAVYVFVRHDGVWSQQAYLKASDSVSNLQFGTSVAIQGDRLIVGAKGKAYLFSRTGTEWVQEDYLLGTNTGGSLGNSFGAAVDIEGDLAVVGDPNDASSTTTDDTANDAPGAGAVSVFQRTAGGIWLREAYLKAAHPDGRTTNPDSKGDAFGVSVSLSSGSLAVGANHEASSSTTVGGDDTDNTLASSGAAYVFTRSGTTWQQQAHLKAANAGTNDLFGQSVAIKGDTLLAGAPGEASAGRGMTADPADNSAAAAGAAYFFTRTNGVWSQQKYLKASNAEVSDGFGTAVALDGQLAAVSGWYEGSPARTINGSQGNHPDPKLNLNHFGAVYVFGNGANGWIQTAYVKPSNARAYDEFGGNFIGLSNGTLIAGEHKERSGGKGINGEQYTETASSSGSAYLFSGFSTVPDESATVTAYARTGQQNVIDFTSPTAAVTGWKITGSTDMVTFPDDLTSSAVIVEISPGVYRATVNLTGKPEGRYFLRIEH